MRRFTLFIFALMALVSPYASAWAFSPAVEKVADGVYAIVGPMEQRDAENLGNNATFGLIETAEGLVLVDPGGTYKGAKALHEVIKGVADDPVVAVINTGGQDHRWLGNKYWKEQGATIYASAAAVNDHRARETDQLVMLRALVGADGLAGTEAVFADTTFQNSLDLEIGGVTMELRHNGQAHTPGDAFVWLPEAGVLFSGDIIYLDRMLGVGGQSNSKSWLTAFAAIEAKNPQVIVPGHGYPADLEKAQKETKGYLTDLRSKVRAAIDNGGDAMMAGEIDQSDYAYLKVADQIAGRNAQAVFMEMEWE